jgi:hypothetical protein
MYAKFKFRYSKFEIQNSKFKIQNSEFKIQNSKFKIQNSKFKIQNSKFKIQNSRFKKKLHFKNKFPDLEFSNFQIQKFEIEEKLPGYPQKQQPTVYHRSGSTPHSKLVYHGM